MDDPLTQHYRRRVLQGMGVAGVAGIAGCLGGDDDGNGDDENGDENGDDGNGDDTNGDDTNGDEPEPAFFEVSDPTALDVTRGETLSAGATIENTGEEEGTQDVTLVFDGEEEDSTELTLEGGDSSSVAFDLESDELDPGDYDYEITTEDDDAGDTVAVDPIEPDDPLLDFGNDVLTLMTGSETIAATLANPYSVALSSGEVTVDVPDGWEVTAESGTTFDTLDEGGSQDAAWDLTVPDDAEGEYELAFEVAYDAAGEAADVSFTQAVQVLEPLSTPAGLNVGNFEEAGGVPEEPIVIDDLEFQSVMEPDEVPQLSVSGYEGTGFWEGPIDGTDHDVLYETEWWGTVGGDFDLEFVVENGLYDVTFHFADPVEHTQEEGARVFDVSVQGDLFLEEYDIYAEAGGFTAITETIEAVAVTDNTLTIETTAHSDAARLSGFEIRPVEDVENLLVNAGAEEVNDGEPADWDTQTWDGEGEFSVDDSAARSGEYSFRIDSEEGLDGAWNQTVEVEPDTDYTLVGWVRTEGLEEGSGFGAQFNVHELGQDSLTEPVTGTSDWTMVGATVNSGDNEELQINALMGGWGTSSGTAWWDDVMFFES